MFLAASPFDSTFKTVTTAGWRFHLDRPVINSTIWREKASKDFTRPLCWIRIRLAASAGEAWKALTSSAVIMKIPKNINKLTPKKYFVISRPAMNLGGPRDLIT